VHHQLVIEAGFAVGELERLPVGKRGAPRRRSLEDREFTQDIGAHHVDLAVSVDVGEEGARVVISGGGGLAGRRLHRLWLSQGVLRWLGRRRRVPVLSDESRGSKSERHEQHGRMLDFPCHRSPPHRPRRGYTGAPCVSIPARAARPFGHHSFAVERETAGRVAATELRPAPERLETLSTAGPRAKFIELDDEVVPAKPGHNGGFDESSICEDATCHEWPILGGGVIILWEQPP
jgi:hypothetical protein